MSPNERTAVPCDGCTECCRSNQGLVLHPERGDDVQSYQHRAAGIDEAGNAVFVLVADDSGRCVYLGENGCTIYDRRPFLCRNFDCREFYLMLPRQDRDNLVKLGLSSRAVFNAGKSRVKTLSAAERLQCRKVREEHFS